MKKKLITVVLAAVMVLGAALTFTACGKAKIGKGESYGLVHNAGYVGAVTVVADSKGKVSYVRIDEFMLPTNWANGNDYAEDGDGNNLPIMGNFTTKFAATTYAKYIQIGAKYFEATGTASVPVYKEIGVSGGIADLMLYLKPSGATAATTLDTEPMKWYAEAAYKGDCIILKSVANGAANSVKIKDAANGDVSLAYDAKAVGSSGGINKAFSSYGSAAYDWVANTSALESFIYEHGTGFVFDDMVRYDGETQTGKGAAGERGTKGTWKIGDATTTVTATDMPDYFMIAKKACEKAQAAAK